MKRLLLAALLLILAPPSFAQSNDPQAPGGFLDRIIHPVGEGDDQLPDRPPMVVVLDAGHGGDDPGARGPQQGVEKNVTLRLAILIRQELEKGKAFRVVMTREEDRSLTPVERLEIANGSGALLLVSLHAAGGNQTMKRPFRLFINDPTPPPDTRSSNQWGYLANRHEKANRRLATTLTSSLKKFYGTEAEVVVIPSSRLFLGGADLPTVMAEVVDLAGEKIAGVSNDEELLKGIAVDLAEGIANAARQEASYER